ncbi:Uma2 family endonuclease [Kribbella capetownensis]|uniref:Uma2 family endonuclease n=1 Tax=Kribbella capetownensis TaxID=1572659 RepID=UPI001EDD3ADF|nr:Uma2 family endonuclease [Kribbella capetownensis]
MISQQLAETPRDGRRYEIVAGRLLTTGAQPPAHHAAVTALMIHLKTSCPPDLMVAVGSLAFRPTRDTTLRPDILVCPRDYTGVDPPLLAVEVVSPSTRTTDVVLKRALYETHRIPSYWLLDPTHQELTLLTLTPTGYTCQTVLQSEETFHTTHPFPLTLTPSQLLG